MISRRFAMGTLAAGALLAGTRTWAQGDRSLVRILIGWPAGNAHDFVARMIAERMQQSLGRSVIVENKPGANQRLALGELRRAAPDGRLLAVSTSAPFSTYSQVYAKLDYDPIKDFTPIARVTSFDMALVAAPSTEAKTLKELVAWLKAHRDRAAYGSAGAGGLSHFVGAAFAKEIDVDMVHVPYKDNMSSMADVSTGRIPMIVTGMGTAMDLHRTGRARVVAISGEKRTPLLSDTPTLKEEGFTVSVSTSLGVYGPANMAPELVQQLNQLIVSTISTPEARNKISQQSVTVAPSSAEELRVALADEYKAVERLIKAVGYLPQ